MLLKRLSTLLDYALAEAHTLHTVGNPMIGANVSADCVVVSASPDDVSFSIAIFPIELYNVRNRF